MYLDLLQGEHVAGIILVPAPGTDPKMIDDIQKQGIPIVLLDRKLQGYHNDCVTSDNFQGAYIGTKHLIDLGYKRIGNYRGITNNKYRG